MLTRQNYKTIAEVIKNNYRTGTIQTKDCLQDTAEKLADYFVTYTPLFNREKFLKACGL